MTIAATVSSDELSDILTARYVDQYFEARLINLPAFNYDPSIVGSDATLLGGEVPVGQGGYARQIIAYTSSDVGVYADGGVAMVQKGTTFAHDGGAIAIDFSHVALCWSGGNITALGNVTSSPASMTDGTYTNVPVDSSSGGGGVGATVDITVTSGGAGNGSYAITLASPGYNYLSSDSLTINQTTLAAVDPSVGAGDLVFDVSTIYTSTGGGVGELFTVAKTSNPVSLTGGNEAAFYWNLKQYGLN